MRRCRFAMLRACRVARTSRILLLAGALLAVAGSFGLHPEPLPDEHASSSPAGRIAWTAGAASESASHGCMACLAHRSVSLAGLAVFVPASDETHAAPPASPVEAVSPSAHATDDGRAPPAAA